MDALPPLAVPDAELAVARAIARRLGRPVFAVVTEEGRRLVSEPEEPAFVAYAVDPRGRVRYGPAGRPIPPPPGAALVRDPASIPADVLAAARDLALAAGATVFVTDPIEDPEDGPRFLLEPPMDGTLRFAVRPHGALLVGDAARDEPARRVADVSWATRTGPALRALRRLADRGEALATTDVVSAREWGRVERLVPRTERDALHPRVMIGLSGPAAAERIAAAVERELARLRGEAERLLGSDQR